MMENLLLIDDSTTKQARTTSTQEIEVGALNRQSMLEILKYFALVLIL